MPRQDGSEHTFDRAAFLRVGAGAAGVAAATALRPGVALAGVPAPTPKDDDVAYVQFGATAELVAVSLAYAMVRSSAFTAAERRRLAAIRAADKHQFARLSAVLGPDSPQFGDFTIVPPPRTERTRPALLNRLLDLSTMTARVYLTAVSDTEDAATRTLIGRVLWAEVQNLGQLRDLLGRPVTASGLPSPLSLDDAAPILDSYLGDQEPPE